MSACKVDPDVHFELRDHFLFVRVSGQNSAEAVIHYMQLVVAECTRTQCFRVLIDEQLDGPRLDVTEIFSIASEGAMKSMGIFQAIAYVDTKMGDMADFAETVAVNRGMPIKSFASVDAAERWLLRQSEGAGEKEIFEEHNSKNRYR